MLIELILVLMIFMVFFLSGLVNGLSRAVSAGIDNITAKTILVSEDAENLITISNLDEDVLNQVKKQTYDLVAPLDIQRLNLNVAGSDKKLDVTYFAIEADSFLMPEFIEGKAFMKSSGMKEIILDKSFKGNGINVGDIVVDSTTNIEMQVVGFTSDAYYGHTSMLVVLK